MSFIKIYIHLVWSTYQRQPLLNLKELRLNVWKHIKENSLEKDFFIDTINGYSDYCHCLISLSSNQNIEKIVQLIKGQSSFWINKNEITNTKFQWQKEYFAVSIFESMIDKVRNYIKNQELRHQNKTYEQEYKEFIDNYQFNSETDFG